mmetsp:Transcript_7469/g.24933  ORF Transcript_7469/g.24933 Transcript_7469/m.24933 type:complete len:253 (+) Transcript_7469:1764-2522(+)
MVFCTTHTTSQSALAHTNQPRPPLNAISVLLQRISKHLHGVVHRVRQQRHDPNVLTPHALARPLRAPAVVHEIARELKPRDSQIPRLLAAPVEVRIQVFFLRLQRNRRPSPLAAGKEIVPVVRAREALTGRPRELGVCVLICALCEVLFTFLFIFRLAEGHDAGGETVFHRLLCVRLSCRGFRKHITEGTSRGFRKQAITQCISRGFRKHVTYGITLTSNREFSFQLPRARHVFFVQKLGQFRRRRAFCARD